jgi:cysteine desulfurase / selenocysteine lyase
MSAPDPSRGAAGLPGGAAPLDAAAPAELRLALGAAPGTGGLGTGVPTSHVPTPGAGGAVGHLPTAPTLPDVDPLALGQAMMRLANELFSAPPAGVGPGELTADPSLRAAPGASPEPRTEPHAAPPSAAPDLGVRAATAAGPASPRSAALASDPAALEPSVLRAPAPAAVPPAPAPPASTGRPPLPATEPAAAAGPPWLASPTRDAAPFSRELDVDAVTRALAAAHAFDPLRDAQPAARAGLGGLLPADALRLLADAPLSGAPDAPYWLAVAAPAAPPVASAPATAELTSPRVPELWPGDELRPEPEPALARPPAGEPLDPHAVRRQFPILHKRVHGRPLVWLDNAATTQKPQEVIDRLSAFYRHENSNIHRAAHTLAARATEAYEAARGSVRRFLGAASTDEIVFVRGATEAINLVAQSWGRQHVREGDELVLTELEHHANIVPWQQLASASGARLRVAPVDDRGQILLEEYERLLGPRTKLVAITQVSNALGTITPVQQMVELAHRRGARVLVDGAQAVSHLRVDMQALDCDFYVLSGHKVFAPTGIGALYGKRELLEDMPPWQGGGNMIQDVTFERTTYQPPPARFEAGTGNIADAVGLGSALDWLTRTGLDAVAAYEHELLAYATEQLHTVPGLTLIGTAAAKAGVLSFVLAGRKTQEVGGLLDQEGIAVRSGHHCAQPILRRFGLEATVRASLAPYNTRDDIDALTAALRRLQASAPRR